MKSQPAMRPHNAKSPLNLRNYPVCYLCGSRWNLVPTQWTWRQRRKQDGVWWWKVIVQCSLCLLLSYAQVDEAVVHSREWKKHRR